MRLFLPRCTKAFHTVAAVGCVSASQGLGQVERKQRTGREGSRISAGRLSVGREDDDGDNSAFVVHRGQQR